MERSELPPRLAEAYAGLERAGLDPRAQLAGPDETPTIAVTKIGPVLVFGSKGFPKVDTNRLMVDAIDDGFSAYRETSCGGIVVANPAGQGQAGNTVREATGICPRF